MKTSHIVPLIVSVIIFCAQNPAMSHDHRHQDSNGVTKRIHPHDHKPITKDNLEGDKVERHGHDHKKNSGNLRKDIPKKSHEHDHVHKQDAKLDDHSQKAGAAKTPPDRHTGHDGHGHAADGSEGDHGRHQHEHGSYDRLWDIGISG